MPSKPGSWAARITSTGWRRLALATCVTVLISLMMVQWFGTRLLDWAIDQRQHRMLRLFLGLGISPEGCTPGRVAPSTAIVLEDDAEALEILIDSGFNLEWSSAACRSAPMLVDAALFKRTQLVRHLVDAGANINALWKCETAYSNAFDKQYVEIANYLEQKGAYTGFGCDPLSLAPLRVPRR